MRPRRPGDGASEATGCAVGASVTTAKVVRTESDATELWSLGLGEPREQLDGEDVGIAVDDDAGAARQAGDAGQGADPGHDPRGISLPRVIEELRPYLIGWRGYFGFCQTPQELTKLEAWIRRRLRMYLWRQWRNGCNRFRELRRRGVPKFLAAVAAGSPTGLYRMSGHPAVQMALRNHVFDTLGLPRLYVAR